MNNFEERIARVKTNEWRDDALVDDLYAALQAKDAEIAELRGLLKGVKLLWDAGIDYNSSVDAEGYHLTQGSLKGRITTALAGKEQPK